MGKVGSTEELAGVVGDGEDGGGDHQEVIGAECEAAADPDREDPDDEQGGGARGQDPVDELLGHWREADREGSLEVVPRHQCDIEVHKPTDRVFRREDREESHEDHRPPGDGPEGEPEVPPEASSRPARLVGVAGEESDAAGRHRIAGLRHQNRERDRRRSHAE